MLNFEKDILWIFSSTDPEKIPSYMLGSILPANYLKIKKVVFLDNHNPKKTLEYYNPKLIIVSKALHDKVVDLVKLAREFNIKVISIFDDWHFVDSLSRIFEKRFLNPLFGNLL